LTWNAIQEVNHRANFGFMNILVNVFHTSLLTKILLPATNVTKPPEACQWGNSIMSRLPLKNIWSKRILMNW
jgi:hypothetical protein